LHVSNKERIWLYIQCGAVAKEIDVWCNKAASLEKRLSDAATEFEYLQG